MNDAKAGTADATEPVASVPPPEDRYRRARKWTYDLIQSPEIDTRLEQHVRMFITVLILLNVAAVMAETVKEVRANYADAFFAFECFSVAVFSIEYMMRVWSIVEDPMYSRPIIGRLRYIFSFFALIDLAAILPFFLPMFVRIDLRTVRLLRLLRLTRVLKLGRYSRAVRILLAILRNQREQLVMSMLVLSFLLVISSTLIYYLEYDSQPEVFSSIPASLWWGVVTLTTIGYGDVYPVTIAGKICAAISAILSIGMVALPSGIIVSGFVEEMEKERALEAREPHHVQCPNCGTEFDA